MGNYLVQKFKFKLDINCHYMGSAWRGASTFSLLESKGTGSSEGLAAGCGRGCLAFCWLSVYNTVGFGLRLGRFWVKHDSL